MKKIIIITAAFVAILSGCNNGQKRAKLMSDNDSLRNVIEQREAVLDEMISSINIIEEGFRSINEAQGRINLENTGSEKSQTAALQENIKFISNTLAKNKEEIARLQKQLENSRTNSKQLKTMINNLQEQLLAKSNEIALLQSQLAEKNIHIEELDKAVTALTKTRQQNEQTILNQENQINTVWYAIGTKRELKELNILDGGEVLSNQDAQMDYFTKSDMRELKSIDTQAKNAKLLTTHPEGSYTLTRDANKIYTLNITDAESFWSVSRYLVIQVR